MVAVTDELTVPVATAKVPPALPAGTVTVDDTLAALLFDERFTMIPPLGAGPPSVTVPVTDVPPVTLAGLRLTDERVITTAGVIASEAVLLMPS